jgi:pilus assembly protein CpaD
MPRFATRDKIAARRSGFAAFLLALALAGCSPHPNDMVADAPPPPDDYHQRHPIVLTNLPNKLDVFLVGSGGKMDRRQTDDLQRFALDYRSQGEGRIAVMLPMISDQRSVEATFTAIRGQLAKAGVRGSLEVGRYPVTDEHIASTIQLSFVEVQAQVPSKCGQWPDDLASGTSLKGWDNKTYENFGCATQTDFAMQVADPRDLVRPRAESPSDSTMRLRAIGNIEEGLDPGTAWENNNTSISPVGAN